MDNLFIIIIVLIVLLVCLVLLNYVSVNTNHTQPSKFGFLGIPYSSTSDANNTNGNNSNSTTNNETNNFGYYATPQTCSNLPGCCSLTKFGCCPDGLNSRVNYSGSNCPKSYNPGRTIPENAQVQNNNPITTTSIYIPPEMKIRPIVNPQVKRFN